MLEEPGAHDVGGLLGQNPTLVLGRVFLVAERIQVLVELQLELREDTETQTLFSNGNRLERFTPHSQNCASVIIKEWLLNY